jgi:hypothetical protein
VEEGRNLPVSVSGAGRHGGHGGRKEQGRERGQELGERHVGRGSRNAKENDN